MARYELSTNVRGEQASQGGGTDALMALGLMYCSGRDVAVDLVQAHKWFNLAALRGNAEARRHRSELALEMTKAEVARAQRLAREWLAIN